VIRSAELKTRKVWRELSVQKIAIVKETEESLAFFWRSLFLVLHRAYAVKRYIRFVALVCKTQREIEGFKDPVVYYEFLTNQPAFCWPLRELYTNLVNENFRLADMTPEERRPYIEKIQVKRKEEWKELVDSYRLDLSNFPITNVWDPIEFTFDGVNRAITIRPRAASGNLEDYPGGISTTSEMLIFVAAMMWVHLPVINMNIVERNIALARLTAALLDESFDLNNIRVAADDAEEWDYLYLKFDLDNGLTVPGE
jgi:hypothetical protein